MVVIASKPDECPAARSNPGQRAWLWIATAALSPLRYGIRGLAMTVLIFGLMVLPACTAIKAGTTRATTNFTALSSETPAGVYALDQDHTTITFKVRHFNFSMFVGRFDRYDGTLQWDPANPTASRLDITIETASINTRNQELDKQLRDKAMFDSAVSPQAHFVSTQVARLSDTEGEVRGDLTIKGETHPVTLHVTFNGGDVNGLTSKPTLGFSATTEINRQTWHLGEWFPVVGADVRLEIEAEFEK